MIESILLASMALTAPAPFMGKCEVSAMWGSTLPETIPTEQQRHVVQVQDKQIYWNGRRMTTERLVSDLAPDMADGSDMLVIDASTAKCTVVKELAAALEGPAACTPERCFVSAKTVPKRKEVEAATPAS